MLIYDGEVQQSLRGMIAKYAAEPTMQEDLLQECLIHLWKIESENPGKTRSWYLQSCRFHLQHILTAGRSVDSPKRANGQKRVLIDDSGDTLPHPDYHTNGEFFELLSARDIVFVLTPHLTAGQGAMLRGFADGFRLREIAGRQHISYPTALKNRRKIAAITVKLGIARPTFKKLPVAQANKRRTIRVRSG